MFTKTACSTFALIVLLPILAWAERISVASQESSDVVVTVLESSDTRTVVRFDINAFNQDTVDVEGKPYFRLRLSGESFAHQLGAPELPVIYRSLGLPDNVDASLRIVSSEFVDISNTPVVPSDGGIVPEAGERKWTFGSAYYASTWVPSAIAELADPFIMRGIRGVTANINAFQYQPTTHTLRVFRSITVEISADHAAVTNVRRADASRPAITGDFQRIYQGLFLNYGAVEKRLVADRSIAPSSTSGTGMQAWPDPEMPDELGEMLIVVYDDFHDAMLPFVEWKQQKGMKTTMVRVSETANYPFTPVSYPYEFCPLTAVCNSVKSYIQNYYNEHPTLSYVLLVGDGNEIPAIECRSFESEVTESDFSYSLIDGVDAYPDVIVGRFSASTVAHVQTQVSRSIDYEKANIAPGWLEKAVNISDLSFAGGEMDQIRDLLVADGYQVDNWYCQDAMNCPEGTTIESNLIAALNGPGRSVVNYYWHGNENSWAFSPFTVDDVRGLHNTGKLPILFSIACRPGHFVATPCFAEAMLQSRENYVGDPIGAVGAYMSSEIITGPELWNGIMSAIGDLTAENGNSTYGGMCFHAAHTMVQRGSEAWAGVMIVFGDPSLQVRKQAPGTLAIAPLTSIDYNAASVTLSGATLNGAAAPNIRCGLYGDSTMWGSSLTDVAGQVSVPLSSPIFASGPLLLTVTARDADVIQMPVALTGLTIQAAQLPNTIEILEPYTVTCKVFHDNYSYSTPALEYRVNSDPTWQSITMTSGTNPDEYSGQIPAQAPGSTVYYRVSASNENSYSYVTPEYSFWVVDYAFTLDVPEVTIDTELYNHPVYFDMGITNEGAVTDYYTLSVAEGLPWTATFVNMADQPITQTSTMHSGLGYAFRLKVIVGSATPDAAIDIPITVASGQRPELTRSETFTVVSEGAALTPPFADDFAGSTLDLDKWRDCLQAINKLLISSSAYYDAGGARPQPYSACLYTSMELGLAASAALVMCSGLTSKMIDLSSFANAKLSFWGERGGMLNLPEGDDELVVEYMDGQKVWQELARYGSTYFTNAAFTEVRQALPLAALHSRTQIRFYSISTVDLKDPIQGDRDHWFIDDASIYVVPSAPVLSTPISGTHSTNQTPTLTWQPSQPSGQVSSYHVEISLDPTFAQIHRSASVTGTTWTVTPALGTGAASYYWRVNAQMQLASTQLTDSSAWSTTYTYVTTTGGGGGGGSSCPVLFAYNGAAYQEENPLLTRCEESGYKDAVTDYYLVQTRVDAKTGLLRFELREQEDEITYLDSVSLLQVDHSSGTKVGCSVDGFPFLYNDIISPIAAIDQDGNDWLEAVSDKDNVLFTAIGPGELTVTFEVPAGRTGLRIAAGLKPPYCIARKPGSGTPVAGMRGVNVSGRSAEVGWNDLATLPLRERPTDEYVLLNAGTDGNQRTIELRITWPDAYVADVISLVVIADEQPVVSPLLADCGKLTHKDGTGIDVIRPSEDRVTLIKGDVLALDFKAEETSSPWTTRDYVVKASGRYVPVVVASTDLPVKFELYFNYPNPFNPTTTVEYDLPVSCQVNLKVYNVLGQEVITLVNAMEQAGHKSVVWNGRNNAGEAVASGVYMYRLAAGNFVQVKKMQLIK